jgi:hypothetical protein
LFAATDLLDDAIDRHGVGAINDAVADVCRSLMERCSLRAILARVALLRDVAVRVSSQSTPSSADTFIPR